MRDVLIGLDAEGAAVVAAAFDRAGHELAAVAVASPIVRTPAGGVEQDPGEIWQATVRALRRLGERVPHLAARAAAISITAQSGGTWLIDDDGDPVAPAWLGRDRRAGGMVAEWRRSGLAESIREVTGSAPAAACQSTQLAWMLRHCPELPDQAATVFHGKDWLHACCTGERVTDASDAIPAFGDWRTGDYAPALLERLGLGALERLLPRIVDRRREPGRLARAAAAATGLWQGTPVVLAPNREIAAALAAGGGAGAGEDVGCSLLGAATVHLRVRAHAPDPTGQLVPPSGSAMPFPAAGTWAHVVATPGGAAQIDWLVGLCERFLADAGLIGLGRGELVETLHREAAAAAPGTVAFESGETAPDGAPGGFGRIVGLDEATTLYDVLRAAYEAIAREARGGYRSLGGVPSEVRVVGPLAAAALCRSTLAATLGRPVRMLQRDAASAAGAAQFAALALGEHDSLVAAARVWVEPHLGAPEVVDPELVDVYDRLFAAHPVERGPTGMAARISQPQGEDR